MEGGITGSTPKTFGEAREMGYRVVERKRTQGYVSRRNFNADEAPIFEADGRRKGQLYYMAPAYDSGRYCFRCYLALSLKRGGA